MMNFDGIHRTSHFTVVPTTVFKIGIIMEIVDVLLYTAAKKKRMLVV